MEHTQCKRCRRLRQKLFLKGERCFTPKCAMIRKPYAPGFKPKRYSGSLSEYGRQLAEKQKIKAIYGLSEKQLKNYFKKAIAKKGDIGPSETLLSFLDARIDSVIFDLGWAFSRRQARQLVSHGLVMVNNRTIKTPSREIKIKDIMRLKKPSPALIKEINQRQKGRKTFSWLALDNDGLSASVVAKPQVSDMELSIKMSLIIEYFSK